MMARHDRFFFGFFLFFLAPPKPDREERAGDFFPPLDLKSFREIRKLFSDSP